MLLAAQGLAHFCWVLAAPLAINEKAREPYSFILGELGIIYPEKICIFVHNDDVITIRCIME